MTKLNFRKVSKDKDLKNICEYTIDAFSESPGFTWSLGGIKQEMKRGWELYGAYLNEEVIAAVFLKSKGSDLLTKNTAVKVTAQGSGYSHQIKDFVEKTAKKEGFKRIFHYCTIDNFRTYALNERHRYKKTDSVLNKGKLIEWVKKI
ncbi:MAG: hypothetical protein OXB84_08265 [Halobacteriovoraceae bacterium]|nr:hypothetical protein [Halobacteriovoraceae bacterium]